MSRDRAFFDYLRADQIQDLARDWLTEQGVDVDEALADARLAERLTAEQHKASARRLEDLARTLKRAKRAVEAANTFWRLSRSPADLDEVTAAMAAERRAYEALREACCHDEQLMSTVRRRVAR